MLSRGSEFRVETVERVLECLECHPDVPMWIMELQLMMIHFPSVMTGVRRFLRSATRAPPLMAIRFLAVGTPIGWPLSNHPLFDSFRTPGTGFTFRPVTRETHSRKSLRVSLVVNRALQQIPHRFEQLLDSLTIECFASDAWFQKNPE